MSTVLPVAASAFAGAFTWTFLEYVIHRWLGHDRRYRKNPFAKEHIRHHIEGDYFAPTWKKMIAAALALALVLGPALLALGFACGLAYSLGLIGFYSVYEIVHRRDHTSAGFGPYGRWQRRHHFSHHFTDARFNHGVTSPLWDFVFRTYRKPETIVVPRKLCMTWLRDDSGVGIRADWAHTFVLAPGRE